MPASRGRGRNLLVIFWQKLAKAGARMKTTTPTQASLPTGTTRGVGSKNHVMTAGANYWPHPQVVIKADYQKFDEDDGNKGDKRFNLGLGYMF